MNKQATHEVELNFFYLHFNDAKKFSQWAKDEQTKLKSLYARHAILAVIFASEALINRVFNDFYIPKTGNSGIEKLSISDKWLLAPLTCTKNQTMETFDSSAEPFQSFLEFIKIRNWLVHPKADNYLEGRLEPWTITTIDTREELPWVEIIKSKTWPQTKIPVNPFELTENHANKAVEVLSEMIEKLKNLMPEQITDSWLQEINFIDKKSQNKIKLTIASLWGGYTPERSH